MSSTSSEVAKIPRPKQFRGLLHSQIKRNLTVAIGLTIVAGIAWKLLVSDPRRQRYADFYKYTQISYRLVHELTNCVLSGITMQKKNLKE